MQLSEGLDVGYSVLVPHPPLLPSVLRSKWGSKVIPSLRVAYKTSHLDNAETAGPLEAYKAEHSDEGNLRRHRVRRAEWPSAGALL